MKTLISICFLLTYAASCIAQPLSVSITDTANLPCNGVCVGSAAATPSGGTPPYTYLWNDPLAQTDSTATGLCAGAYTVRVSDAAPDTVFASVTITGAGGLSAYISSITSVSCNGVCDGSAKVTASGGTPPYTYSWTTVPVQTTDSATVLCAGNDTVTVTDNSGCITKAIATITEPAILSASISVWTNVSCYGDSDGTATASASGGTPPYSYTWLDVFINTIGTSATVTGLWAATFLLQVEDANKCVSAASVSITAPAKLISVISDSTNASCNGFCDGSALLATSGGTLPYTYSWSNLDSTSIADSLCAGVLYTAIITDANGCDTTASVIITEPPVLTSGIIDSTNASCNGVCDGSATLATSGGTLPYTYSWSNGDSTVTADSLCAALIYTVTVTDSNGCDTTASATITEPPVLTVGVSSVNAKCGGLCDGSASATASGGTPPYTFSWNTTPVQTDSAATGVCPGTYIATITDANGCTAVSSSVTITEPDTLVDSLVSITSSQCSALCDGSATVSASGGTPPYSYLWNDPKAQTSATADSLCASTFIVTVTDSNGCTAALTVIVTGPGGLTSSIDTNISASCNGICDGAASVKVTGGTPPYTYAWVDLSPPPPPDTIPGETDSSISGLCAGSYMAVVTDSNGCITSAPLAAINEPTAFSVNITGMAVSCNGDSDGVATAFLTNGISPFDYMWSNGDTLLGSADTTNTTTGLAIGSYSVTVTDANGCIATDSTLITEPPLLTGTITDSTDVSCGEICDGSATLSASGGTPPYTYLWNNPAAQTGSFADSLCMGIDTVTITDANGCNAFASVTISGPPVLTAAITGSANISCNGYCDGSATLTTGGGLPPYTFSWNTAPVQTDSAATGLCPGIYTVTVTDANTCTTMDSVTITEPPVLTASITDSKDVCETACNGSATLTASGGTPPYTYLWTNGDTNATATVLCAGNYTVTITDANGCMDADSVVIISDTQPPTADLGNDTTVCAGEPLLLKVAGGITYLWNTGDTGSSITVSPSSTANYIVTVTNIACFDTDTIIVRVESCDCKTVEPIPQIITPNSDGKNDVFEIPNIFIFPGNELTIFNRWGNRVFSKTSYSNDWNGKSTGGDDLPDGTYFYIIDLGKDKCQGYVMIHR